MAGLAKRMTLTGATPYEIPRAVTDSPPSEWVIILTIQEAVAALGLQIGPNGEHVAAYDGEDAFRFEGPNGAKTELRGRYHAALGFGQKAYSVTFRSMQKQSSSAARSAAAST